MHELPGHRIFCNCHFCLTARIEARKKTIQRKTWVPKTKKRVAKQPMKPQGPKPYPAVRDGELVPFPEDHPPVF
jgi:hypothetical protein